MQYRGTDKLTAPTWSLEDLERHAVCSSLPPDGPFTPSAFQSEAFFTDVPNAAPKGNFTLKFGESWSRRAHGRGVPRFSWFVLTTFLGHPLPPTSGSAPKVDAAGNGFWSVQVYTYPDHKLVANEYKRYSVTSLDKGLQYDANGGLSILLSSSTPTSQTNKANWLPIPASGPFAYALRIYAPDPDQKGAVASAPVIAQATGGRSSRLLRRRK